MHESAPVADDEALEAADELEDASESTEMLWVQGGPRRRVEPMQIMRLDGRQVVVADNRRDASFPEQSDHRLGIRAVADGIS